MLGFSGAEPIRFVIQTLGFSLIDYCKNQMSLI